MEDEGTEDEIAFPADAYAECYTDADSSVMIDADATGESAFSPDVCVPVDAAAIRAMYDEGRDCLFEYVLKSD